MCNKIYKIYIFCKNNIFKIWEVFLLDKTTRKRIFFRSKSLILRNPPNWSLWSFTRSNSPPGSSHAIVFPYVLSSRDSNTSLPRLTIYPCIAIIVIDTKRGKAKRMNSSRSLSLDGIVAFSDLRHVQIDIRTRSCFIDFAS